MKKSLIIYMPKLSFGGMEQSLINLLNMSDITKDYNVTLFLVYTKDKEYLRQLPKNINIHLINKKKWNTLNKIFTSFKLFYELIKVKFISKYDIAISYSHHHEILSKLALSSSDNTICFIHADLDKSRTKEEVYKLNKKINFLKYKKIICVSQCAKKSFVKLFPDFNGKVFVANNYVNEKNIISKSKEKITDILKDKIITFIHSARHEEESKKISRIIISSKKLVEEGYKFRVILLGDGESHKMYKEMIYVNNLQDNILLIGSRVNPYPYYKLADALLLTSDYEGYGIVTDEARVLNIPIISTDVGDSKEILNEGYGILCDNSIDGVYKGMKRFLDKGFKTKRIFDSKKFNNNISKVLNEAIGDDVK